MKGKNTSKKSEEFKNNIRETKIKNGTYHPTKEATEKRIESRKKNGWFSNPDEHKRRISEKMKGRIFSEETKRRMKEGCKKRPTITEETRKKMRDSKLGKKQTPEHIEKRRFARWGNKNG